MERRKSMLKVGAVILAAGMSTRMGKPKLLLPLNGQPLFKHALKATVDVSLQPIVLIAGHYIEEIRHYTHDFEDIEIIYNQNYANGMASSLKLGIQAVKKDVDAVMVFLADQPLVSKSIVQLLIDHYKAHKHEGIRIVRSKYKEDLGHPILFDAELFNEFDSIEGDQGGKEIIKKYTQLTKIISFDNQMWGMDVDTPEDYLKMKKYFDLEHYT
ncbi:NTP transferase domain-containing protein [Peribacillus butanolivorans]|uniref:nucleotidyltransferase family protein n=1 Tax=Peribacillus butanolivorans TaxID=421767 RepID=UPI0036D9AC1E